MRGSIPWNTSENASENPQRQSGRGSSVIAAPIIVTAAIVAAAPPSVTAVVTIVATATVIIVTDRTALIAMEAAVAVGTMESAIMETPAVKSSAMKTTTVKTAAMEPVCRHRSGNQQRQQSQLFHLKHPSFEV
jgi:hypothetical protein